MKEEKIDRLTLTKQVKNILAKTGLTQEYFVKLLGVSVRTLCSWDQGLKTPPKTAQTLLKIADKYPEIIREVSSSYPSV